MFPTNILEVLLFLLFLILLIGFLSFIINSMENELASDEDKAELVKTAIGNVRAEHLVKDILGMPNLTKIKATEAKAKVKAMVSEDNARQVVEQFRSKL